MPPSGFAYICVFSTICEASISFQLHSISFIFRNLLKSFVMEPGDNYQNYLDVLEEEVESCQYFGTICEEIQQWRDVFYWSFVKILETAPHSVKSGEAKNIMKRIINHVAAAKEMDGDAKYLFAHKVNVVWRKAKGMLLSKFHPDSKQKKKNAKKLSAETSQKICFQWRQITSSPRELPECNCK